MSQKPDTMKFRPYLSLACISSIYSLINRSLSDDIMNLDQRLPLLEGRDALGLIIAKNQMGLVKAAYVPASPRSSPSDIGLFEATTEPQDNILESSHGADIRKVAYQKWIKSRDSLTDEELDLANTYRFENDLMPFEERNIYMDNLLAAFSIPLSDVPSSQEQEPQE